MNIVQKMPREPQYAPCVEQEPPSLGPMTGWTWRQNPFKLGMTLARYKFVARMFEGKKSVAEIGCGDAFGSAVVKHAVQSLALYDFDAGWKEYAEASGCFFKVHDIVESRLVGHYHGIYMLDVLEHIAPCDERRAVLNISASLTDDGVFIAGCPSLESQKYASEISKAGHVNCRSGNDLRAAMLKYFHNVFLFGMNDEVLHVGFPQMCHYLFVLCTGPRTR